MKVLFITKGYPSESNPLAGNYEAVQAHAIASLGHQVSIAYFSWKSLLHVFEKTPLKKIQLGNVDVYEMVGIVPTFPIISRFCRSYKLEKWMMQRTAKRFAREYKLKNGLPEIIHIHSQFIAKYAMAMKEEFVVPVVLTEHWSGLNEGKASKNMLSEGYIYRKADAVIVVSHALESALKSFYGIDSHVIFNMVSDEFFLSKAQKKSNQFRFVSVGRMVSVKCFENLVYAMNMMSHTESVRLTIVGDGPERVKLEKLIRERQLQGRIELTGLRSPNEVSEILCQSDCFVLSSHRETFGIVLIEAMAKGLPVISTKCGGPEDFVNKDNGILVDSDNPGELAKAMDYMIENHSVYDYDQIRNYCMNNFSQNKVAQQIVNIYKSVI